MAMVRQVGITLVCTRSTGVSAGSSHMARAAMVKCRGRPASTRRCQSLWQGSTPGGAVVRLRQRI